LYEEDGTQILRPMEEHPVQLHHSVAYVTSCF